ncbi:MAG: dCTP deaminase [Thermoplasmata archaeon]|nr:MAG: dCTP deaminase [Thermoplasmata archaeon]
MLSDKDIKRCIKKGEISIEPFNPENMTPNGYDLTIKEIMVNGEIKKDATIPPLTWFAIGTAEYIKLHNKTAQLWIRSSYARKGILSSFGKVDAGFEGTLTLSCFNTREKIHLSQGERFCQIVFEEISSLPKKSYCGKYKGQKKITLE